MLNTFTKTRIVMAKKKQNIQMRLDSVSEMGFSLNPGFLEDNAKEQEIQLGFSASIEPDIKNDKMALIFGVKYMSKENTLLESVYKFVFTILNLEQFIQYNDDKFITVNQIMPHFLSVAVGTTRGILVVKTAGTKLSRFPLPMIDVNQLNEMLSTR